VHRNLIRECCWPIGLALLLASSSCSTTSDTPFDTAGPSDPGDDDLPPGTAEVEPSPRPNVRFKGGERLRNDLARSLGLEPDQVCNELGRYSCTDLVHTIALGGVEAYVQGVYTSSEDTTATAPLAVERVVLAACTTAVDRDLADAGEAAVFGGLDIAGSGELSDPDAPDVAAAIVALYRRGLQRSPTEVEVAHLRGLYESVQGRGGERVARDWAVASCFAVLTTMESLFY